MKIFLVGIKGSGMAALASILKDLGHTVVGSDVSDQFFIDNILIDNDIKFYEFGDNILDSSFDFVIKANAFTDDNIDIKKANSLGIHIYSYLEYLNILTIQYKSIAISGTNGKTTTTGLVKTMLKDEQIISLIGDGTGEANVGGEYFVFEACEYKNNFLELSPNITLINNIDLDHPDFFKSIDQVKSTFENFADKSEILIVNIDDLNTSDIIEKYTPITFGLENGTVHYEDVEEVASGYSCSVIVEKNKYSNIIFPFYGKHMMYNTLASIAIGYAIGKDTLKCIENIKEFKGTRRRFEQYIVSPERNLHVVDDYAHHPQAIELTINACKHKYKDCAISVIFQAHTYSRTIKFLDEFSKALASADNVLVADIFGSIREKNSKTITTKELKESVEKYNKHVQDDLSFISNYNCNHVVLLLGAGNIDRIYLEDVIKIMEETK